MTERTKPNQHPKTPSIEELTEIEKNLKNYHFDTSAIERTEAKDLLGLFIADLPKIDKFNTLEEDIALAQRVEAGGEDAKEAREALLYSVSRMVVSEAAKRTRDTQTLLDLTQEGMMAVWQKATVKYDYRMGVKFSTYALWWIKNSVGSAARKESRIDKVSDSNMVALNKMKKKENDFKTQMGREPSIQEISLLMGIKPSKTESIRAISRQKSISLSEETVSEDGTKLEELIKDPDAKYGRDLEDEIDQEIILNAFKSRIETELKKMRPRTAVILRLRLGITEEGEWINKPMTLTDIGKVTQNDWPEKNNVSRNRVKQLQRRALANIEDVEVREVLMKILE